MTKHLALTTVLAATLAAGSAYAAGDMDRSAAAQGSVGTTAAATGATTAGQPSTESVRMMQQALQNEGYDVQVDGIWGPNTQQALNEFQQRTSSMAAAPSTGMGTQQALTPDDPARGMPGSVDRGPEGATVTEELGWDRAGGIREGAEGEPGGLGTGRGEIGAGGGGASGAGGGPGGAGGGAGGGSGQ